METPQPLSLLIVEDEVMIRMLLADMIEELGHRIAGQAARVSEALALIEGGLAFDGAILDLNLAGQTAEPVAEAIEKRNIPFFFASGYGAAGIPEQFRGRPFVQKPFAIDRLAQALRALRPQQ